MILPNSFVTAVLGIDLWCYIKHAVPQLKLVLTSPVGLNSRTNLKQLPHSG